MSLWRAILGRVYTTTGEQEPQASRPEPDNRTQDVGVRCFGDRPVGYWDGFQGLIEGLELECRA
jgi:hypothetical protein